MTIESTSLRIAIRPAPWQRRLQAWRHPAICVRYADILAVMTAAALPWSTSATAILTALWLIVVIPTIDWEELAGKLAHPAFAFPLALFALAVIGVLWSEANWPERLQGIKPAAKLLFVPFLLYHFQRSQRGQWVFVAFLISCTLMMILSWIVLAAPGLKLAPTASDGVPVKNYIDQSQEFALCAFALALPALLAARKRQWIVFACCVLLILLFLANMLFVASARTALIYIPVLLVLFAVRHLGWRSSTILVAGSVMAAVLVWTTSPYLRQRIADIRIEYHYGDENMARASTAQRLNYWRKSVKFFVEAPVLGHGTGSIKRLFERDAVGQTGVRAEIVKNPHNQTLGVAVQWGLVGIMLLYAMWFSHFRLFADDDLAAWIGLVVVAQNFVSSLLNSHLFDFHQGWMYVLGVGVAGGMSLPPRQAAMASPAPRGVDTELNSTWRPRPHPQ